MDGRGSPARLRIPARWSWDFIVETAGGAVVSSAFVPRAAVAPEKPADALLVAAAEQVRAYFARRLRRFDLPLAPVGTPFQQAVWDAVAGLSFGEFVSYADVARAVGRPLAHRGVAAAMRQTPIALLVPPSRDRQRRTR